MFFIDTSIFISEEGYLKDFFHKTKDMSPEERGKYLEEDEVNEIHSALNPVPNIHSGSVT